MTFQKHNTKQSGQILIIVLALLLLTSVIMMSSLTFLAASLKTNTTFKNNTLSRYTAESGVQDAIWNLLNKPSSDLQSYLSPNTYDAYNYYDTWSYSLPDKVNEETVTPQINNVWIPMIDSNDTAWIPSVDDIVPPNKEITPPLNAKDIIDNTNLTITGQVVNPDAREIEVDIYYNATSDLRINSIGVWLPQGYNYINGSSNLEHIYSSEQVVKCAGNEAVIWSFSNTYFADISQSENIIKIYFFYSSSLTKIPTPLSWVTNSPNTDFPYSFTWDANVNVYKIECDAGNTEIIAYVPKTSTRSIGNAISGDYVAIGNSLLKMSTPNTYGVRDLPIPNSSATANNIPTNANLQGAYLYWSGWLNSNPTSEPIGDSYGGLVNFKINNVQVCFDSNGNPQQGNNPVKATKHSELLNDYGYSYSCYSDVTNLVRWELQRETGNINNSGNAIYNVGSTTNCKLADKGVIVSNPTWQQWSYAGWSLILIYSSPDTLGHQLYLFDNFTYSGMNDDTVTNINGFLVPQRITNETEAAKITCFVGEGDSCYAGDFVALNIPVQFQSYPQNLPDSNPSKLSDGIDKDNVWNSQFIDQSTRMINPNDGIDIDTFHITWASGLVNSGDNSARIDMPTQSDSWNLIYTIVSFRSSITSGGAISYLIREKQKE
jgi:hypothetical protein